MEAKNQLLISEKTPWGNIEVWQNSRVRDLYIQDKSSIQSRLNLDQKEKLLLKNTQAMMSFLLFQPNPESALLLGLGGGGIIHFLSHWFPELKITAVDISKPMLRIAKKYFEITNTPQISLKTADALTYLTQTKKKNHNVILIDIHDGKRTPDFLYDPDFVDQCFQTLSSKGVLVINAIVNSDQNFLNIMTALRTHFTGVSLCMPLKQHQNILLFAFKSRDALDMDQLHNQAILLQQKYDIEFGQFVKSIVKVDAKK